MSDRIPNDHPTGSPPPEGGPTPAAQSAGPPGSANTSVNASASSPTAPVPGVSSGSTPTDPTVPGPTGQRPNTFTYSLPIRLNSGLNGPDGQAIGIDDHITWTFELIHPPNQPGSPPHGQAQSPTHQPTNTANEAPRQPDVGMNHDPLPTNAPVPPAPPRPSIGPFGVAGARPGPHDATHRLAIPAAGPAFSMFFGAGDAGTPGMDPTTWPHILNSLMPIFASGLADRRADPVKAAELIRALQTVDKNMMARIDKVLSADWSSADADEEDEGGWKCSVCFEGAGDAPTEGDRAVKATPCHHLFHAGCLEPWFKTHTSW